MEIFVNTMDCLTIFSCVLRTCGPYFNLVSICRPNTLMSVFGSISVLAILIDEVMLNLLGFLDMSRTGQGIELMFLGIGLGDQDVFINKAIAR